MLLVAGVGQERAQPHLDRARGERARAVLLTIFHFVGGALMLLIAWKYFPSVVSAYTHPERNFMGNPGFFMIPQWPLFTLMFIGIVAIAIQFLIMAFEYISPLLPDACARGPSNSLSGGKTK